MKLLVGVDIGGYTFNAAAKTVTLTGLDTLNLEQILLITNVTRQEIIYQFNSTTKGATIAANVLTLEHDTTAHNNADRLQIFVDYHVNTPSDAFVNPTRAEPVHAFMMVWNGSSWDRLSGTSAGITLRTQIYGGADAEDNAVFQLSIGPDQPIIIRTYGHVWNGSSWDRIREAPTADAQARTGFAAAAGMVFNGATWDRARGNTSGAFVQGPVAHDSPVDGNPLVNGGVASASVPAAVTEGDAVRAWFTLNGAQVVSERSQSSTISDDIGNNPVQPVNSAASVVGYRVFPALLNAALGWDRPRGGVSGDAQTPTGFANQLPYAFNGATWDRSRNNVEANVLSNAARTATVSSADQINYEGTGIILFIFVSTAGTGSITVSIEGKFSGVSGTAYYTILASAAITANGLTVLRVHPGITPVANLAAADVVPRKWRVTATHNNANSMMYEVWAVSLKN